MASGFDEAKVFRAIIDPMRGRYTPPKGVDHDVVLGDYVTDLSEFSEDVLQTVFNEVRRAWEYKSWPPSSTFRKECQSIASRDPATVDSDQETFLVKCRVKAVRLKKDITGSQKYIDAGYWSDGLFFIANKEIEDRIYQDLLAGGEGDPRVTVQDMERWRRRVEESRAWAKERGVSGNIQVSV
jgi:hypothetical protein